MFGPDVDPIGILLGCRLRANASIVALNNWDFDAFLTPESTSPNFTKHLGPQSISAAPQTREQWYQELTSRLVGQNYKQWQASIQHYWEDVDNRRAIAWCSEAGLLVDGDKYEMDYIMRYEFDEDGKLKRLFEYTDSELRKWLHMKLTERQNKDKDKEKNGEIKFNRPRFWLITYPRSASNLLVRMLALEEQPNVLPRDLGGYFFIPAIMLAMELKIRGKHIEEWTQDERNRMNQAYEDCFRDFEEHLERAEAEDKMVFVKEHSSVLAEPTAQSRFLFGQDSVKESPWRWQAPGTYGAEVTYSSLNETLLPDEFLQTWLPTFLIRHPALAFPSRYRAFRDIVGSVEAAEANEAEARLDMTLHWTRKLYDWYTRHLSQSKSDSDGDVNWPLVLDADDVMTDPNMLVRFCEIVGMDPTRLRFTWAAATEEQLAQLPSDITRRMLSTLTASASIIKSKTSANLDIGTEAKKWREEFGEVKGEWMEKLVRAAMPDYEFLKSKRLRPKLE